MAIALAALFDEKQVDLDVRSRTRDAAIRHLTKLLVANGKVRDPDRFIERVLAREQRSSSAIEHGIAFPHARTDAVDNLVLAIGRSHAGISFGGQAEQTRLIFLIGVPQRLVQDYLVCVGALARIVNDDSIRAQLLGAESPTELVEILRTAV